MLAQRPPYAGSTPQETLDMHLHAPVPDIQQYRQGLCAQTVSLVSSLLAKNPDERPADAAVVSKLIAMIFAQNKVALAAMIAGGGPKAAPAVPAPLPRAAAPKPVPRGLPRRGARPGPRGRR